jgi:hypothetical protein
LKMIKTFTVNTSSALIIRSQVNIFDGIVISLTVGLTFARYPSPCLQPR